MKKLLIIKTGSSDQSVIKKCGDCDERIARCVGIPYEEVSVISVYENVDLILPEDIRAIIITGSPSMITDFEPWSIATSQWLEKVVQKNIPILGICFGHQLIAQTLGGSVDYHELGEEKGEVEIQLTEEGKKDPLFSILPNHFSAYASHQQTVKELPENARVLARNNFESFHGISFRDNVWGVQFHPECISDSLCDTIQQNPYGVALLKRFYELAV